MRKLFTLSLVISIILILPSIVFSDENTELYKKAKFFINKNSCEDALPYLEPLLNSDYILKDYVLYDIADCYKKLDRKKDAFDKLIILAENYKSSPVAKNAYLHAIELMGEIDLEEALRLINEYLTKNSESENALLLKLKLLEKAGKREELTSVLANLFLKGGDYALLAYSELIQTGKKPSINKIEIAVKKLYMKGFYQSVIEILNNRQDLNEGLKLLLGKSYFNLRDYYAAIRYLSESPNREAKILLTNAYLRVGDKIAADICLRRLAKESSEGLFWIYERFADIKRRERRFDEAEKDFIKMLEIYSDKKDKILWNLAWLNISSDNYDKAEKYLQELVSIKTNNDDRDRAIFWLCKIFQYQRKDAEQYCSLLKNSVSYYAFRLNYNGNIKRQNKDTNLYNEQNVPKELYTVFRRAEELHNLKMNSYASTEIKSVAKFIKKAEMSIWAKLLMQLNDFKTVVYIAESTNEVNEFSYPIAFYQELSQHAKEEIKDIYLILAVMREESRFDNYAKSRVGALGLMQLMPQTASKMVKFENNNELYNPDLNIKAGVKYLSWLLKRFRNIYHAIAAYNAGERRVVEWIKNGYKNDDEFVEDIPFLETRNYVKKVIRSYFIYKNLYEIE